MRLSSFTLPIVLYLKPSRFLKKSIRFDSDRNELPILDKHPPM